LFRPANREGHALVMHVRKNEAQKQPLAHAGEVLNCIVVAKLLLLGKTLRQE
jgi:hypothetical protein